MHKPICKKLPYKIASSKELGNFMVANKDLKQGEVRSIYENKNQKWSTSSSSFCMKPPWCLVLARWQYLSACIATHLLTAATSNFQPKNPLWISFRQRCPKSGWPLCGPDCNKKVMGRWQRYKTNLKKSNNSLFVFSQSRSACASPDWRPVWDRRVLPGSLSPSKQTKQKQTKSLQSNVVTFQPCYLYECITPLRALMLQKTAPSKWKVQKKIQLQIHPKSKEQSHYFASQTLMKMESHIDERRGTQAWEKTQATVVDVMKKTLGIMVCWGLPKNN